RTRRLPRSLNTVASCGRAAARRCCSSRAFARLGGTAAKAVMAVIAINAPAATIAPDAGNKRSAPRRGGFWFTSPPGIDERAARASLRASRPRRHGGPRSLRRHRRQRAGLELELSALGDQAELNVVAAGPVADHGRLTREIAAEAGEVEARSL